MIRFYLLFVSGLCFSTAFSQSGPAEVFLKNKQVRSCQVREVRPNGLLTDEGILIAFKVVDSLQITDRSLADLVSRATDGERVAERPGFTSIDLRSCTFPVLLPSDSSRVQHLFIYGILSSSPVTVAGLRLDYQTSYFRSGWIRVDFAVGNADNLDKFLNAYSGSAAAGYKFPVIFQPQLFLGFGAFYSSASSLPEPFNWQFLPFLQTGIEAEPIPGKWLLLSAGSTLYLKPLRHDYFSDAGTVSTKKTSLSLYLGIGINLSRL